MARSGEPVVSPVGPVEDSAASTTSPEAPVRVGLVLSAGGLRGAAHLGVLRRIVSAHVPIAAIVGVSAGAIIATYYAAVGLSVDEMIADAPRFRGRHLLFHGLTLRAHSIVKPVLRRFCGVIPVRLGELERCRFDRLHHGVDALGIVCHDLIARRPVYFSTRCSYGARLCDVARASAVIRGMLPARTMELGHQRVRLCDGGLTDSLPIDFAFSPALGATHLIASDCRTDARVVPHRANTIYLRPQLNGIGVLHAQSSLMRAVEAGEAAVTDDTLRRVRDWVEEARVSASRPVSLVDQTSR